MSIGVLLVNLGTPDSYKPKDVKKYLTQFLTDGRVIDIPWFQRQLLVRGVIIPKRYKESAASYQEIWRENGSPLKVYGEELKRALQEKLGEGFEVELAMRYQTPSIASGLAALSDKGIKHLLVVPLFPHYASATTGSVHQEVMEQVSKMSVIPFVRLVQSYADHPGLIAGFVERAKRYDLSSYDHILFSYHGLPQRQLKKADRFGCCLVSTDCCKTMTEKNSSCYGAQCWSTTRAIVKELMLEESQYTHCYQSRLGKDPWMTPYTSDTIASCAKRGIKRLLVFCPSFVADCLETLHEIQIEYGELFKEHGGEKLELCEGLNCHPAWVEGLAQIVQEQVPVGVT